MSIVVSCPTCAAIVVPQEAGRLCPQCHSPLALSEDRTIGPDDNNPDVTRLVDEGSADSSSAPHRDPPKRPRTKDSRSPISSGSSGWLSSSGAIDHGRFEPGALLGGRYRIIERLGRGGMGEVYRADDLKLGQPVALKFLPSDVDKDPARLTQLHTEVRMARQVSHPNVCRVYDIDEVDGQTFLSMEYVDGEDLASLLRRIGRFPEDRAVEIGRQICAGLAAAHERDVIHRDLKPANVMLDGTGKVRITDFGLAGAAGESIRAGTPAYMAPEQLAGNEVTARSDIYALGLLLYEIFTGQRALDGKNLAELIRKREQSGIMPPTAIVKTLDPKIEQAIMRCLRPVVDERPPSALAVAAALPGGDPLAAALAAGETPSPQMVAAAGAREALSARTAVIAASWVMLSLALIAVLYQRVLMVNRVPIPKPPAALQDRAQEALSRLGYNPRAVDDELGTGISLDYARYILSTSSAPDRWKNLTQVRPETFFFWYRTSPSVLIPFGADNQVNGTNPPLNTAGMTLTVVDAAGRLTEFIAVPDPIDTSGSSQPVQWRALFEAAGLPFETFKSTASRFVPPTYADERVAWEGPLPERPDQTVRIEAAARAGKPVFFGITGPWTRSSRALGRPASAFTQIINALATIIMPGLMLLGAVLARVNLKAGRGDHHGAFQTAAVVFILTLVSWAFRASHPEIMAVEINRIFAAIGRALFSSAVMWLTYLGLEPYIRRYAPDSLLGWTRLLAGHWRDPRVAVDVLIGVSAGLGMTLLFALHNVLPPLAGYPEPMPIAGGLQALLGTSQVLGALISDLSEALSQGMLAVVGVVGFGLLFRRFRFGAALATLAAVVCFTPVVVSGMFSEGTPRLDLVIAAGILVIFVLTIQRTGLLAAIAALFTHFVLLGAPITLDFGSWRAPLGYWYLGTILVLGLGACYLARTETESVQEVH
jgi:serine/threonine protein kinase